MKVSSTLLGVVLLLLVCSSSLAAKPLHHYVFFGQDSEKITDAKSFLETRTFEGAQVAYSWRQLEPEKDKYDFSLVRDDLGFLTAHGKRLWIQIQDVSFSERRIPVPNYLLQNPQYHGGADPQYKFKEGDEEHATGAGWAARRWDAECLPSSWTLSENKQHFFFCASSVCFVPLW